MRRACFTGPAILLALLGCADRRAALAEAGDAPSAAPHAPAPAEAQPEAAVVDVGAVPDVDGDAGILADVPADIDEAMLADATGPALPPLDDDAVELPWRWDQQVRRLIDRSTLST